MKVCCCGGTGISLPFPGKRVSQHGSFTFDGYRLLDRSVLLGDDHRIIEALRAVIKFRIVQNMAEEGNINRYGISNGLSYLAHSVKSIDRKYELEKNSYDMLNISDAQWEELSS